MLLFILHYPVVTIEPDKSERPVCRLYSLIISQTSQKGQSPQQSFSVYHTVLTNHIEYYPLLLFICLIQCMTATAKQTSQKTSLLARWFIHSQTSQKGQS